MTLKLFVENVGGDVYAAESLEEARRMWCDDTGMPDVNNDWKTMAEDKVLFVETEDDVDAFSEAPQRGYRETTVGQYASEVVFPGCVGSFGDY